MRTAHEILVAARNGIERDGLDMGSYGETACGTPRCVCGWVAFAAGEFALNEHEEIADEMLEPTGEYEKAMVALLATAPARSFLPDNGVFDSVEAIGFRLLRQETVTGDRGLFTAWFDAAVNATAPPPPDPEFGHVRLKDPVRA